MRRLSVFNQVSLDGYFVDRDGDMSWAHKQDIEWGEFVAGNASGGGALVFGRVTYEMMAGAWSSLAAAKRNPAVAERMNGLPKVVFSRTLSEAAWQNTRLIKDDPVAAMRSLKQQDGPNMVILGSGTIVAQLTQARLIDEYQIVVNALVLGGGRTMFEGVADPLHLTLVQTRSFANGNVVLTYQPA